MEKESHITSNSNNNTFYINNSSNTISFKNKTSPLHMKEKEMILYRLSNDKKSLYNNFNHSTVNTADQLPAGKFTIMKNAGTLTRQNTRINRNTSVNISNDIPNMKKQYLKQKTYDDSLRNGLTNVFLPKINENEVNIASEPKEYVTILSLKEKFKGTNKRKKRLPTTVRLEMQIKEHYKKMISLNNDDNAIKRKTITLDQLLDKGSHRNTIRLPKKTYIFKRDKAVTEDLKPYTSEETRVDTKTDEDFKNEELSRSSRQQKRYNPPAIPKITPPSKKKRDWRDKYRNIICNSYIFNKNQIQMAKTGRQIKRLENKITKTFEVLTKEVNDTIHLYSNANDLY